MGEQWGLPGEGREVGETEGGGVGCSPGRDSRKGRLGACGGLDRVEQGKAFNRDS
jgi:hypothetical protein